MNQATTLPTLHDPIQRVSRFQTLAAGQYWRAQEDLAAQHVEKGEVLLIESLRWVDEAVHTVVLRAHPSKYGRKMEKGWSNLTEHRFLLQDFLRAFVFEPDAIAIRAEEVRVAQGRIAAVQSEIMQAQRDPSILEGVVAQELAPPPDLAALPAPEKDPEEAPSHGSTGVVAPPAPAFGAEHVGDLTLGQAVQQGITAEGVEALREHAQRAHQVATIKANWIKRKTDEVAQAVAALTPFFSEQAAAALAATEDVRTYVADLLRGIESLDLYVGKGVEVQTLRTGNSAPEDVPLTFVQKKLLMDEELAVWADVDEAFDISSQSLFAQAMHDHQGFVDQVFPTPRCVLVMATTHRHLDYGNALSDALLNEKNREVFLLVRDGDNVYKVHSPVETHLRAARLFPTKDEHEAVFKGLDGTTTKFEDVSYTDRMADHDLFALHYRRFLILACGLDHRLGLFGKFYPGPPSMAFLSLAFQSTYCRFLYDDDRSVQIAGRPERPALAEWIAQKNDYLRAGSCVLCNWPALLNPDTAPGVCQAADYSSRRKARLLEGPGVKVAAKDGGDVCVTVTASRRAGPFQARVALNKHKPYQWDHVSEETPYLVLDAVEPDDLRWYLHHRESRKDHITYIRLFKRGLAFIEAEREVQGPTRAALRQALLAADLAPASQAEAIVSAAVTAWRAAHRGQELPTLAEGEALTQSSAGRALLDQMFALVRQDMHPIKACEALASQRGETPIRMVLTGKSKYVLYTHAAAHDRDDRGEPFIWVRRLTLEVGKRGGVRAALASWARLPQLTAAETTVKVWDADLEARMVQAGLEHHAYATPQQKAQVFALLEGWEATCLAWSRPLDAQTFEDRFEHYCRTRRSCLQVTIPLGVRTTPKKAELLCAQADLGILLGHLAPTPADRARVREAFAQLYVQEEANRRRFDAEMNEASPWRLKRLAAHDGLTGKTLQGAATIHVTHHASYDPLLSSAVADYQASIGAGSATTLVLAPDLASDLTRLDAALGLQRPSDYAPTSLMTLRRTRASNLGHELAAVVMLAPCGKNADDEHRVLEHFGGSLLGGSYSLRTSTFATRAQAFEAMQHMSLPDDEASPLVLVDAQARAELPAAPVEGVEVFYALSAPGEAN